MNDDDLPAIIDEQTPTGALRAFARGIELPDENGDRDAKRPPAVQMRMMLRIAKVNAVPFERAWAKAWENIAWPHPTEHRQEWKYVLSIMREVFHDGYEDRDPAARLTAISAVEALDLHDHQAAA